MATETTYTPDEFELGAINLVMREKKNYEDSSQVIRDSIKKARKNYACVFDNPVTSTGVEKIFVPITRWEVDAVVPKIQVNDKAITVLPETEPSVRSAFIAEKVLKYQVKETRFPMYFKNSMYDLGIDGTTVWTNYWNFEREMIEPEKPGLIKKIKNSMKKMVGMKLDTELPKVNVLTDKIAFKQIDLLDCYIDPTSDSIQDAQSFIFRNQCTLDQVKRNKLYKNTKDVTGITTEQVDTYNSTSVQIYEIGRQDMKYELPMAVTYERWGRFPLSFLTKNPKDKDILIDGVITVANAFEGTPVLLRVMKNPFKHGLKPFEECWFQKKKGRWYGIGMGEKLLPMQKYYNKTVNRRSQNEDMLHAGLFVVKRGAGLSAKSIASVPGGIIEVDQVTDVQQLQIQDISQLSNGTIQMLNAFIERINGASEITLGSAADRSATTSIIKDRNADTRFASVRGYVNDFLFRFFTQWLANDRQFIDRKFTLRVTGEDTELKEIDDVLGIPPEIRALLPQFRFIDVTPNAIKGEFGLEIDIDQSIPMNKAENAERILKAIQTGKEAGVNADYQKLFYTYLDNIGIQGSKYKTPPPPPAALPPTNGTNINIPTELQQFQDANQIAAPLPATSALPKVAEAMSS